MPDLPFTPYALHLAGALGAVGLLLILRRGPHTVRLAGAVLGLAGVGLIAAAILRGVPSLPGDVPVVPALFGVVALIGATRMITHPKPVFSAIYFVLVVISSSGLFLLLHAEFMAFALVIVYAGAILVTYLFVLMLAQQTPNSGEQSGVALYDAVPREPAAAVLVGFLLFATLGEALFSPRSDARRIATPELAAYADHESWLELEALPKRLTEVVRSLDADATPAPGQDGRSIRIGPDGQAFVRVAFDGDDADAPTSFGELALPESARPTNTQSVGLALVARFPASLELASVILLMAMFGAVVLARKQIELGEDERREAAGLKRLSVDDLDPPSRGGRP